MNYDPNEMLSIKQLADGLAVTRVYVWWMKKKGFTMPGNRATINEARAWLVRNEPPCSRKKYSAVNIG